MNDQTYTTVPCSAYDVIAKDQIHVLELNTCDTAPNPVINMVSCLIQNRHGEYNNAYNRGIVTKKFHFTICKSVFTIKFE